jgi:hypothetical protein
MSAQTSWVGEAPAVNYSGSIEMVKAATKLSERPVAAIASG